MYRKTYQRYLYFIQFSCPNRLVQLRKVFDKTFRTARGAGMEWSVRNIQMENIKVIQKKSNQLQLRTTLKGIQ